MAVRTVGVEEEFLLVDPVSGRPRAVGGAVLQAAEDDSELTAELHREQLETGTRPCVGLDELGRELRGTRAVAAAAASAVGVDLVALATSPLAVEPTVSPSPRYRKMAQRFGLTVDEVMTCGCHVHVAIDSAEEGVAAADRIRPWLAPLLALSVNSPFWQGADSGYASFRSQLWTRWPSAGPYELFGSPAGYRGTVAAILGSDTVLDEGMIYFDARLSRHHPTLEIRVADVCLDPDDAVLIAALARALVETAVRGRRAGCAPDPVRTEVLRLASWRAGRSGLDGELLDPTTWRPAAAADVLNRLMAHVAPALEDAGELETVRGLLDAVLRRGTGATRQRQVLERTGDLSAVVAAATAAGRGTG
ncbi:carboxylate-amine ligase [Pseudonocardia bannensis]|uniref:Putative glutamate--cysteine ligase 2 n=1 Tax=Pseudonocardia bannensis TaxID=630973 RepID=A0A848DKQ8_9PSEU|nr:glutamate--cysteine ligase [Pseudonocardia bannensis]NMH93051.1 glutamate--cysteine ligase [Pseudonocardia bannensis]